MTDARLNLSPDVLERRLAAFLGEQWKRPVRLKGWRRFPAGFSWITIGFQAELGSGQGESLDLILRIGDPRGLLAPYRAEPEFRALEALQAVAQLPVPMTYAYSDDASVIGAPFLITGRVDGDTPLPWKGAAEQRPAGHNESLVQDFLASLAALHAVDWTRTSLGRLWGDVDAAEIARNQVAFWWRHAHLDRPGAAPLPQMHHAMRWLNRHAPVAPRIAIVHGDYRVGNFLQRDGRITAILDWELVHPGDPHEDLAWAALRIFSGGTGRVGGLLDREAFLRRYAQLSGIEPDPTVLHWYEVLGLFKSASMLLSAGQRIMDGRGHDIRMASMGFQVTSTLLELNRLISEAVE